MSAREPTASDEHVKKITGGGRAAWQKAVREAEWEAAQGPLGPVILKQRSRRHRADNFASWLMAALLATVLAGLGYYVGLPLWIQLQDAERRGYVAQANLLASQLDQMDNERADAWDAILHQVEFFPTPIESRTSSNLFDLRPVAGGSALVASGSDGAITRSTDGGETWALAESGVQEALFELQVLSDEQTLVAVGYSGVITRSTDGGETWLPVDSGLGSFEGELQELQVLPDGRTLIAIGSPGAITRSTDGGETWTAVESGTDLLLRNLRSSPDGQTLAAIGIDAFASSAAVVIRSTDRGETWTAQETIPVSRMNDFHILPDERGVLAAGDSGHITIFDDRYLRQLLRVAASSGSEGDTVTRVALDALPDHVRNFDRVASAVSVLNLAIPPDERIGLELQLRAAQSAAVQIASGGFSLEQRRADFASFMEDCMAGAVRTAFETESGVELADMDALEDTARQVADGVTGSCAETYIALREAETSDAWELLSERVPQAILLLFLLATLGGLYRYNLRLSGFYHSRADALELLQGTGAWTPEALAALGEALAADKVEFGKSDSPSDQAVEMAKAILARR